MNKILLLILLCCMPLWAVAESEEDVAVGDWYVNLAGADTKFAYTENKAGEILGQFCGIDEEGFDCLYLFTLDMDCESGEDYLALVNSDAGASHQKITCGEQLPNGSYNYYFYFGDINGTITGGSRLAIVVPTQEDQFKVLRFSLKGAREAIEQLDAATDAATMEIQEESSPDEETL